jgi:hypothetical protein
MSVAPTRSPIDRRGSSAHRRYAIAPSHAAITADVPKSTTERTFANACGSIARTSAITP